MPMMRSLAISILQITQHSGVLTAESLSDWLLKAGLMSHYRRIVQSMESGRPLIEAISFNLDNEQMHDLAQMLRTSL